VDLSSSRSQPNLHFLGRRPYETLPAYCRHFDVGLIPFKVNELTRAVNPIKLREYLAAGLPVVSTPMPEVALYKHLIEIADSPLEVEAALARLLNRPPRREERMDAMASECWPAKVSRILDGLKTAEPSFTGMARR
jgi:glycosyltransferase involved in cell wall biosynthesis